jgi:hypothetical protein
MHTVIQFENLEGRDHLEDLGIDGRIILVWTGFLWLMIGTSGCRL